MTEAQRATFEAMAKRFTEEHTRTRELARALHVREGIHLPNGRLAPEYGGKTPRKAKPAERRAVFPPPSSSGSTVATNGSAGRRSTGNSIS